MTMLAIGKQRTSRCQRPVRGWDRKAAKVSTARPRCSVDEALRTQRRMHPVLSERSSCWRRCSRTESCLMAGLAGVWFALRTTEQPDVPSLEFCEEKSRRNQNLNLAHQSSRVTGDARVRATLAPQGGVGLLLQYRGRKSEVHGGQRRNQGSPDPWRPASTSTPTKRGEAGAAAAAT